MTLLLRALMLVSAFLPIGAVAQAMPADRLAAANRLIAVVEAETSSAQLTTPPKHDLADCMDKAADLPGGLDCQRLMREQERVAAVIGVKRPQLLAPVRAAMQSSYARRFTADELDAITAFYKTPAGKHLLRERPALEAEMRQAQNRAFAEAVFGEPLTEPDTRTGASPQ